MIQSIPCSRTNWVSTQRADARSVVVALSPNGPTVSIVGGLYAEVYYGSERRRWRFYAGQSEPEVGEVRARGGDRLRHSDSVGRYESAPDCLVRNTTGNLANGYKMPSGHGLFTGKDCGSSPTLWNSLQGHPLTSGFVGVTIYQVIYCYY